MGQVQPVPLMAVAVSPAGRASLIVTTPTVGPAPLLVTVIVYVAAVCPCVTFPEWVLVIVRSDMRTGVMVVTSLCVSLVVFNSSPPEPVTVLVTDAAAFAATLTVRVIGG